MRRLVPEYWIVELDARVIGKLEEYFAAVVD